MPNPWPTTVDRTRLARAVHLEAERLPDGRWRITGGSAPHIVDLTADTCDCPDHAMRRGVCKHLARARLAEGDADTLRALGELLPAPKRERTRQPPGRRIRIVGRELVP